MSITDHLINRFIVCLLSTPLCLPALDFFLVLIFSISFKKFTYLTKAITVKTRPLLVLTLQIYNLYFNFQQFKLYFIKKYL